MPLVWKIDPEDKVAVAVADGDVTRLEVESFLDAIAQSGGLTYRKVFDVHKGDTSMTADDILPLAVRVRSLHELGRMGPLAVILPSGRGKRLQRVLGMLAAATQRPMRVFEVPLPAYRWIAKQDLPDAVNKRDPSEDTLEGIARKRNLAARIRRLARAAGEEARALGLDPKKGELLYQGHADLTHRGVPLSICVRKVERSWQFQCCRADRATVGTLLTLGPQQIATSLSEGRDPLRTTLNHIKALVQAGSLSIPDDPSGDY
jgi:hypothetical protein